MRWVALPLLIGCGGGAPSNTVAGSLQIGDAKVLATCELSPSAQGHATLTLVTPTSRLRVAEQATGNDYDVSLDGKLAKCSYFSADGGDGRDGEKLWWRGNLGLACKAGDVAITADLTIDCGR